MGKGNTPKLLFTDNSLPLILEAFGKSIDENGLIVDSITGEPILTPDLQEIEASKFMALKKGSEIFIKDDLTSIIKLVENAY